MAKRNTRGDDKLAEFTSHDNDSQSDRRSVWSTWTFAVGLVVSLLLNVVLTMTIFSLFPLKTVEPYLITWAEGTNMPARAAPFRKEISNYEVIGETLSRDYVTKRHTILNNNDQMQKNWGPKGFIYYSSTLEVFNNFVVSARRNIEPLRREGITREVEILRSNPGAGVRDGVFEVEFKVRDRAKDENSIINEQTFVAILSTKFQEGVVPYEVAFLNPLGFVVTDYTIREKKE